MLKTSDDELQRFFSSRRRKVALALRNNTDNSPLTLIFSREGGNEQNCDGITLI
jgi:hypothetical protein